MYRKEVAPKLKIKGQGMGYGSLQHTVPGSPLLAHLFAYLSSHVGEQEKEEVIAIVVIGQFAHGQFKPQIHIGYSCHRYVSHS